MQNRASFLSNIPAVTKNLIIINIIIFVLDMILSSSSGFMTRILALHSTYSTEFMPHQIFTYMFMHGSISHLFFNMFALFMFGRELEFLWGPKRFLTYYLIAGIGAGVAQLLVIYLRVESIAGHLSADEFAMMLSKVQTEGLSILNSGRNWQDDVLGSLNLLVNIPTVGASGSIFGILVAFGMIYPNRELIMIPIPIPIKAKYFVIFYGILELSLGFADRASDNVAHFAHLGGLFTGLAFLLYWKKKGTLYGKNFRQY